MGIRAAHMRSGKPVPFVITVLPALFYFGLIGIGYYVYVITLCGKGHSNQPVFRFISKKK
jgi:hypothetical protein